MATQVRYAKNGRVSLAYQTIGSGPIDIVFQPGFVSHLDIAWEEPFLARFLEGLADIGRVIWFDKRGIGLSDPFDGDATPLDRVRDALAVMDAAGSERPVLFGVSEGAALSALLAAHRPERLSHLIMWAGFARLVAATSDEPGWSPDFFEAFVDGIDRSRVDGSGLGIVNPSVEGDERYRDWYVRYVRAAASPAMLRRVMSENAAIDLRGVLSRITAPTLILHRPDEGWVSVGHAKALAAGITDARFVEMPGIDHWPWLGDADGVLGEIERFLTGRRRARRPRPAWGPRSLTKREHQIARLAASGKQAKEIAEELSIGDRTVETHLANAYLKLGVSSRVELARRAREFGL